MAFIVLQTEADGTPARQIANEPTLLQAIVRALDDEAIDTVDLRELQQRYVPEARLKAVGSESRTRRVRLPEPTAVIPRGVVHREYIQALDAASAEREQD
jgi:hypothetical protein